MRGPADRDDVGAFDGTPRFELVDKLGEGGMGVVYEVFDRERNLRLALKGLQRMSPRSLLRFKDEFRALRDLHHPNLVRLDELIERDGQWYFTMELIDGVDIVEYIRGPQPSDSLQQATATMPSTVPETTAETTAPERLASVARRALPRGVPRVAALDETRLRDVVVQLAQGVVALHRAGSVHRDIKPSNIMISREGRVILLDLGVARSIKEAARDGEVVGTIAYMAPEQAAGTAATFASDWYAVGGVLYKLLTGTTPFGGDRDALERKQTLDAPPVRTLNPAAPVIVAGLCDALLRRDPEQRPSGADVLAALDPRRRANRGADAETTESGVFVGRRAELETLEQALERARGGRATAVVLEGPSGIGKSATAVRFVELTRERHPDAVILRGRCHERESVPFRAFDGIVDDLSKLLSRGEIAPASLPASARRLTKLFPTLAGLTPSMPAAPASEDDGDDGDDTDGDLTESGITVTGVTNTHTDDGTRAHTPQELRHRAFEAFADLLRSLSGERAVVVVIDDAQRADDDSVALLAHLAQHDRPPPVLWLLTARTDDTTSGQAAGSAVAPLLQRIRLGGLLEDDARALVAAIAGNTDAGLEDSVASLLAETRGHPMFLEEVVRHRMGREPGVHESSFDDALHARVARMPEPARRLLDVIAAGGGPVPQSICSRIAAMDPESYAAQIEALRAERLVRIAGPRGADTVEPYHDRVREVVYAHIPDDRRRAIHRYFASEFESEGASDELLAGHHARAGKPVRAAAYYERAALSAAGILAFDHAIRLLRAAIELGEHDDSARQRLLTELGEAMANAGRPAQSAETYLEAAAMGGADELELRRRAAEQYLYGGHVEAGIEATRALLAHVGLRYPRSPKRALISGLWSASRLRWSSLRWISQPADQVSPEAAAKLDVLWSMASGLSYTDVFRAFAFTMQAPILSMRSGDDLRIARALSAAVFNQTVSGRYTQARRLIEAVERAADNVGSPQARFYARICHVGWSFWRENDWEGTLEGVDEAGKLWRKAGRGAGIEVDILDQFRAWSLQNMGRFRAAQRLVRRRVQRARRAGNRFIEASLQSYLASLGLLDDRPDQVIQDADAAIAAWRGTGDAFTLQHYWNAVAHSKAALYRGNVESAAATLDQKWGRFNRSLLRRLPLVLTEGSGLQGGLLVARAAEAKERGDRSHMHVILRAARKRQRLLESIDIVSARSAAMTMAAGIAHVAGDEQACVARLRDAIDAREHGAPQSACSARLGDIVGGDEGAALRSRWDRWVRAQRVSNPELMLRSVLPGW